MTENIKKQKLNSVVWNQLNWKVIERKVFRLQKRIYRAKQRGDIRTVRSLQRLLLKSWYAKLLAVRRVTQDNQGRKSAGVDGIKSLTPKQRLELVNQLSLKDKVLPTRRVWIAKPDGTQRGLGIPVMKDRATQALAKLALEPEWEAVFESNSYGFRPGRSGHDAIEAIFNAIKQKSKYVLDADIAKCFDRINHDYLLNKLKTFSVMRRYIKACLKAGVMDGFDLFPTTEGTPQGGIFSPLLANIALHGMETHLKEWLWQSGYRIKDKNGKKRNKKDTLTELSIIRYADDFLLIHPNIEIIQKGKEQIEIWLKDIGLELKPSKTRITHTLEKYEGDAGFNFLGFNIRQFKTGKYRTSKGTNGELLGYKTIIKPSKEKSLKHHRQLRDEVRKLKSQSQTTLIAKLNPIITGWCNYYKPVCAKKEFYKQDYLLWRTITRWEKRKHSRKSTDWIKKKYWKVERKWDEKKHKYYQRQIFTDGKSYTLKKHGDTEIIRHTKVKGEASPYNSDWVYWSTRMGKHPKTPTRVATLLKKQKGKCLHCGQYFKSEDLMEIDHIIPRSKGGKDEYKNLQLLHRHCHDVKTTRDGSYGTRDKSQLVEEPCEVKVSRTVLKTSGFREKIA